MPLSMGLKLSTSTKGFVCRKFFKKSTKEHYWDCKLCKDEKGNSVREFKQIKNSGWSNLFTHLQNAHKEYEKLLESNKDIKLMG